MTKKFLMYQLSAAQAQVAMLQELIAQADSETENESQPVAKQEVKAKVAPQTKAKAKPVEEVAEESEDLFGEEAEEENNEPTVDDVRKAVKAFATKHGKEKTLKLLGKFKVTSIPDLKKSEYTKVIELAQKHT